MNKKDSLQRFIFEHANVRGEMVYLKETYQTIIHQRAYPPVVKQLLGEALVSCILLAGSMKFRGEIQLQFQGDARLPLLIVQCDDQLHVRACARFQEDAHDDEYKNAFLHGQMMIYMKPHDQTKPYQSIIPTHSTSISENLSQYFAQSEQISTHILLAVDEHAAAGMLLQLMPEQDSHQREKFWEYALVMGQSLRDEELLTLDNETILHRLYHETELRLFEPRAVNFHCRCHPDKMKQAVALLEKQEIQTLLTDNKHVEVHCDFCNQSFTFDAIDLYDLMK